MLSNKKILIMGLPGSGKTTLARVLARKLDAVHFNADEVRMHINKDLGFSIEDRIEQAKRMGWLCDQVVAAGHTAIADFVCPLPETRVAFGQNSTIIFMDTITVSRFVDTNALFTAPYGVDFRFWEMNAEKNADHVVASFNYRTDKKNV